MTPIKTARQAAGLTQKELAKRAGTTTRHVQSMEAGTYRPRVDLAIHLAGVLGVSVEELWGEGTRDEATKAEILAKVRLAEMYLQLLTLREIGADDVLIANQEALVRRAVNKVRECHG